jgi:dUTP pyrophosphatase
VRLYENHGSYHEGDSGLDLYIVKDQLIKAGETVLVDLGITCQSRSFDKCMWHWITKGFYKYHSYYLLPRSSISKTPLIMRNSIGLIDSGYLGSIKAPLYNTSDTDFFVKRGQRYVQLVNADLSGVNFKMVTNHRVTSRGQGGFGSTN